MLPGLMVGLGVVLAVIGYSLNDTIVVSDRIRENFRKIRKADPVDVINISLTETLARTLVTSLTTLLVLVALAVFGGEMIFGFAVALLVGVLIGTYSSIYVAANSLLMLGISLLSARLGLDRGYSIALFPIVILTMVIERMSVIWEESGAMAAFNEGLGSLAVASAGYLLMTNVLLNHLIFLFPELLLVLLGVFVALGRYTGYRLTEMVRFRDIAEPPDDDLAAR